MNFTIGIDTGGTYTDAVIWDVAKRRVVARAKSITTKGDLSIGVISALAHVLDDAGTTFDRGQIKKLVLSTTLATNALVEGHGSSVAAILVGFDDRMTERTQIAKALPSAHILRLDGGHRHTGAEQAPLDEGALLAALDGPVGTAEAFAVTANYAVRNPAHEQRVKELVRAHTGRPVTASGELTDALNGPRRALTATFNARIVGLIVALERAVQTAMQHHGINARIMIVRGDGAIASARSVVEKPIQTILSGPAASVIGARFLSGHDDFVVSDIGGTTTDIALVRDGWPALNDAGSSVGGYRTLVRAVDMQTHGLGGDSEVHADMYGGIELAANRAVPLALAATRYPHIEFALKAALGQSGGMLSATRYLMRPDGASPTNLPGDLSPQDREFLALFDNDEPQLYGQVVFRAADRSRVARFVRQGLLQCTALTPSDAAHVLGHQSQWSSAAAWSACELVARASGNITGADVAADLRAFAQTIFDAVVTKSTHLVLQSLAGDCVAADNPLLSAAARGQSQVGEITIALNPALPVVPVGGPAAVYYPAVGERLGRPCVIHEMSDVANALGAAVGLVRATVNVEITYKEGGGYWLHGEGDPVYFDDASAALAAANELAETLARAEAATMGTATTDVTLSTKRIDIPNMPPASSLMSAIVTAECIGASG